MKKINFIDLKQKDLLNFFTQNSPAATGFIVRVGVKNLVGSYDNDEIDEFHKQQEENDEIKPTIIIVQLRHSNKKFKLAKIGYAVYPPEVLNKLEQFKNLRIKFNFASRPM